MHRWWCFLFAVIFSHTVAAESIYDLKVCEPISDNHERLTCYDQAMAGITGNAFERDDAALTPVPDDLDKQPLPSGEFGAWVFRDEGVSNDGKHYLLALTRSLDKVYVGFEEYRHPELILQCKGGKFDVFVDFNTYVGRGTLIVASKIGNSRTRTDEWQVTRDGESIVYRSDMAGRFVEDMSGADDFWVKFSPPGNDELVIHFAINGVNLVSSKFRSYCKLNGWRRL